MNIDLSRFKVVYGEKVLNAICLQDVHYKGNEWPSPENCNSICKPQFLHILAINEDGNIVSFCDEAWRFQFLPIVNKEA